MPPNPDMPISDDWQNKIMHSSLFINESVKIYLSDSWIEKTAANNTVFLHIVFDSESDLRKAFDILSEDGKVNMPVDKTFWGSVYGGLVDKFGTGWGLEYPLPE